jgi:hypothetical protein
VVPGQDPDESFPKQVKGRKTARDAVLKSGILKIVEKGGRPDRLLLASLGGANVVGDLVDTGQRNTPWGKVLFVLVSTTVTRHLKDTRDKQSRTLFPGIWYPFLNSLSPLSGPFSHFSRYQIA